MPQHFLLSPAARTLSLRDIMLMSDDEAHARFVAIRFAANNCEPFCPHCGNLKVYALAETPPRWKCAGCRKKFSVTSGTLFHSRKLAIRDYLAVIALFCNGVKGVAALRMARNMNINPKSAFVLLHKLREAMVRDDRSSRARRRSRDRRRLFRLAHASRESQSGSPTTTAPRAPGCCRRP